MTTHPLSSWGDEELVPDSRTKAQRMQAAEEYRESLRKRQTLVGVAGITFVMSTLIAQAMTNKSQSAKDQSVETTKPHASTPLDQPMSNIVTQE